MKYVILFGSLMVGLVPYFQSIGGYDQALTPENIGMLLGICGAVILAWAGESPLQKRFYDGRRKN